VWMEQGGCLFLDVPNAFGSRVDRGTTTVATHTHSAVVSIVESLILTVGGFALFKG
jgi:hypothetical protein